MTSYFASNNALAMYIDNTGKVGISTSNVTSAITIAGEANLGSNLYIQGFVSLAGSTVPTSTGTSNAVLYYDSNTQNVSIVTGSNVSRQLTYIDQITLNSIPIATNSFRYIKAYCTSNQAIYPSYCNVPLHVEQYLCTDAFTHQKASPTITMNSNGAYLFFYGASLYMYSNAGQSNTMLWERVSYNSNAYPSTNDFFLCSDTFASKNSYTLIQANANDTVSFQLIQINGNSNLNTNSNNGYSVWGLKLPSSMSNYALSFNSNITALSPTFSTVVFDSNLISANSNLLTLSNNGYAVKSSGDYWLLSKLSYVNSNTSTAYVESYVDKNGTEIPGTRMYVPVPNVTTGMNYRSKMFTAMGTFASNDLVTVKARIFNTSNTSNVWTHSNACTLTMIQIPSSIECFHGYYSNLGGGALSNLNTLYTTTPINTVAYSNTSNISLSNAQAVISAPAIMLALAGVGPSNFNPSNINANIASQVTLDSNNVQASKSFVVVGASNGITSTFCVDMMQMRSNSKVYSETANMKYTSNLFYINNASRFTLITLDKPTGATGNQYGNFYRKQEQQYTYFQTNSSNWSRVVEMNTDYLNNGQYRINASIEYVARCPTSNSFNVRLVLDDSNVPWTRSVNVLKSYNTSNFLTGFVDVQLNSNVHNIRIEANTTASNDYVTIQRGVLDFWELST